MKTQHLMWLVVITIALSLMTHATAGEALVGMWPSDHHDPAAQRQLVLGDMPEIPAEVQADAVAFSAVYDALVPGSTNLRRISPNGRAMAFGTFSGSSDEDEPSGVYVWPDWRDAQNVITFEGFSRVKFRSNHHIYLLHWPEGQSPQSKFVDIRQPDVSFYFSDYWRHLVRITDDGRWAGVTIGGTLRVGQLDPDDPETSQQTTIIDLPDGAEVANLMHRRGGDILIVQFKDDTMRSYPATGGAALDTTQGGMSHENLVIGDHRFYGWNDATEGVIVFSVDADGAFTWEQWPFMAGMGGEGPVSTSPSGRYVITKRHVMPPGAVDYKIRKTPLADDDDPMPQRPVIHPAGRTGSFGWLTW